ncbi:hypothetical protein B0H17DRAFT_70030 [Mycena rosella]|uniref:Uncharacterized protein n=1 Tax=Mycena rosella TaxID=1033263 RepID=A0AAD7D600_MYCRO|nr:hypothetical protein B0H17DRAFT_70030 [Mycena rosella]
MMFKVITTSAHRSLLRACESASSNFSTAASRRCTFEIISSRDFAKISSQMFLSYIGLPIALHTSCGGRASYGPYPDVLPLMVRGGVMHPLWGNVTIPFNWKGPNLAVHPLSIPAGYTTPSSCIVIIDNDFVNPMLENADLSGIMGLLLFYTHRLKHCDLGLPFPFLLLNLPVRFPLLGTGLFVDMFDLHVADIAGPMHSGGTPTSTSHIFHIASPRFPSRTAQRMSARKA